MVKPGKGEALGLPNNSIDSNEFSGLRHSRTRVADQLESPMPERCDASHHLESTESKPCHIKPRTTYCA